MPPLPPARRQTGPLATTRAQLSTKQRRFLRLYCASDHPSRGLSQPELDALPQQSRDALLWVTTHASHLPDSTRKALEAYYATGYKPDWIPPRNGEPANSLHLTYEADIERALTLLDAPNGDLAALMRAIPGLADSDISSRLLGVFSASELKPGEKIRLEVGRLLLQMKGHLREQKQEVVQGTQIVLHLGTTSTTQPTAPEPLTLDLLPKRPQK